MIADSKPIPKPWKIPRNRICQGHQNYALSHKKQDVLNRKVPWIVFQRSFFIVGYVSGVYFQKKTYKICRPLGPNLSWGKFLQTDSHQNHPENNFVCVWPFFSQFLLPYESPTKKKVGWVFCNVLKIPCPEDFGQGLIGALQVKLQVATHPSGLC